MFLSLKNVGKIETANITIDAVTIIAGENNTGKSTVGKTLFCIFNSFYKIDEQIETEKLLSIIYQINNNVHSVGLDRNESYLGEIAKSVINKKDIYINDMTLLKQDLRKLFVKYDSNFEKSMDKYNLDRLTEQIIFVLNISNSDAILFNLQNKVQSEFKTQINNLYYPEKTSEILLKIKSNEIKIQIKNNENSKQIEISDTINLNTEIIYIDNPYAMDNPYVINQKSTYRTQHHHEHLRMKLNENKTTSVIDEIITLKRLEKIFEILNSVCPGEMVRKQGNWSFGYKENDTGVLIDVINMSTGLKTFAIIKTLLLNGSLEENGTLILDEPEIHLHPNWQLAFAEIIVLPQKEFNLHILINTHSPYFLDAIEVYSRKHGIADKCKYYLAEISDNGMSVISDVSDDTERIYEKLSKPFQVLANES